MKESLIGLFLLYVLAGAFYWVSGSKNGFVAVVLAVATGLWMFIYICELVDNNRYR